MNFIYVFYHLLIFIVNLVHHNFILFRYFAIDSITSISGSLSNVYGYGYVLLLVVTLLGISYLVVEDGIQ